MKVYNNPHKTETSYCKICREVHDVVVFKDHFICESCVEYIKSNC